MAFNDTLFQLGMDLTRSSTAQKEDRAVATRGLQHKEISTSGTLPVGESLKDNSGERSRARRSGTRFIFDMYGAERLDDLKHIERTLKRCAEVAGAKLLHVHLHPCVGDGDVSGVAVAMDSHISIHTSPGSGYATVDLIMTGQLDAGSQSSERAADVLRGAFKARQIVVRRLDAISEAPIKRSIKPSRKRTPSRVNADLEQAA